ncbi:jg1062, partial [Pararge aegeria aegeria]
MSQSADEARAARIQRYKEERRKQLTARTATLFSANVTERRPKKAATRSPLEDTVTNLKSSSELNLNTASTSVPIRTTRTSRLRAAATNSSESCQLTKKSNRSSSVQNLLEDEKNKIQKTAKIIDRDKIRTNSNRKQSHEKENLKSASTTCFPEKDNGAIRSKLKHSSNKSNLEKDKNNCLVISPKGKNADEKNSLKLDEKKSRVSVTEEIKLVSLTDDDKSVDVDDILNDILGDKSNSNSPERDRFDVLYNDLIDENKKVKIEVNDVPVQNDLPQEKELKSIRNDAYIPVKESIAVSKPDDIVKVERCVVPKNVKTEVGLLGAVCVRKVERFSELLSNLCSPCEADILFEDILVENGIDGVNSP